MDLNTLWFIVITVLFTGFFILEGFDYGVGILLPFLGKNDRERRAIINTIGPVWDGNEVWMITAGGALFASFPHVYATLFSGFYLVLVLILLALIIRGVAFEFRSNRDDKRWRSGWDWALFTGSLIPALLWGVAVGNLMRGFAVEADMNYYGGLLPLLNLYSLLGGSVFLSLFTMHGASFLRLKTEGEIAQRAQKVAFTAWIVTLVTTVAFLIWTFFGTDILTKPGVNGLIPAILAAISLIAAGWFLTKKQPGRAFLSGVLTIALATVMVFTGLFPRLIISTLNPDWSLTIYNASASAYTLRVMSIVAAIFVPIVLIYQGWTYWVFRKRIKPEGKDLVY
jgi:cytochrome d ubiquinol oxidase subunit II